MIAQTLCVVLIVCVQIAMVVEENVGRWQVILEVDCAAIFQKLILTGKIELNCFESSGSRNQNSTEEFIAV